MITLLLILTCLNSFLLVYLFFRQITFEKGVRRYAQEAAQQIKNGLEMANAIPRRIAMGLLIGAISVLCIRKLSRNDENDLPPTS